MTLKYFTRSFYLSRFFFDFILVYAIEKLFMLHRGLTLSQIGLLLFLWSAMTLLLEVPSGALADRWSRRKMLIISGLSFSICYLIWIFSHSFWGFFLGFLFRTIGGTFTSGTLQAYVYDYLTSIRQESRFDQIWGQGNALRVLGIGIAVGLGGYFSDISFSLPVIISTLATLIVALIAFTWPEVQPDKSTKETQYWQFVKQAGHTIIRHPILLKLTLYSAIILALWASLEEFNDIYLNFLGFSRSHIGFVFALAGVTQSLASHFAHKFIKHSWFIIYSSAVVSILILIAVAFIKHPLMAIPILFLGVMLEFVSIIKEGLIQKEISSHQRATVSSFNQLVMNLVPDQLIFGLVASHYHLQTAYAVFAFIGLTYFLTLPLTSKNSPFKIQS